MPDHLTSEQQGCRAMEMTPIAVWIRGSIPEIGSMALMTTYSATEAALWRSQGFSVTQLFQFIVRPAYG